MSKYKLVPIEPTREMWAAAGDAVVALNGQHHDSISEAVYKAMLAAAPQQEPEVATMPPNLSYKTTKTNQHSLRSNIWSIERRDK